MGNYRAFCAAGLFWCGTLAADSVLTFNVESKGKTTTQPVLVKRGEVFVGAAGGDASLDALYDQAADTLTLIDHRKRVITPVNRKSVEKWARQSEDIQPVIRGIGEQLQKLSPKQREKWSNMLGGIDLEKLAKAKSTGDETEVVKSGASRRVAGIPCEPVTVNRSAKPVGEFCMAEAGKLPLSKPDGATIQSLVTFMQSIAARASRTAEQFGIRVPPMSVAKLSGLPIEMRDLSGKHPKSLVLSGVESREVPGESLRQKIPAGYSVQELALWK